MSISRRLQTLLQALNVTIRNEYGGTGPPGLIIRKGISLLLPSDIADAVAQDAQNSEDILYFLKNGNSELNNVQSLPTVKLASDNISFPAGVNAFNVKVKHQDGWEGIATSAYLTIGVPLVRPAYYYLPTPDSLIHIDDVKEVAEEISAGNGQASMYLLSGDSIVKTGELYGFLEASLTKLLKERQTKRKDLKSRLKTSEPLPESYPLPDTDDSDLSSFDEAVNTFLPDGDDDELDEFSDASDVPFSNPAEPTTWKSNPKSYGQDYVVNVDKKPRRNPKRSVRTRRSNYRKRSSYKRRASPRKRSSYKRKSYPRRIQRSRR